MEVLENSRTISTQTNQSQYPWFCQRESWWQVWWKTRQEASSAVASQVLQKRAGDEFHKLARPLHCTLLHYTALHTAMHWSAVLRSSSLFATPERPFRVWKPHQRCGVDPYYFEVAKNRQSLHLWYRIKILDFHSASSSSTEMQNPYQENMACPLLRKRKSIKSNTALANVDTVSWTLHSVVATFFKLPLFCSRETCLNQSGAA